MRLRVVQSTAQPVAVVVALIMACIFIAILVVVVISSVNELAGHAEKYTQRINAMVQWVVRWGEVLGMDISNQGLTEKLTHHTAFLSELVVRTFSIVAEELSNGFLMLLFTVYLLLGYATSTQESHRVSGVRAEIDTQVKRYIGFKMLLSASTGASVCLSCGIVARYSLRFTADGIPDAPLRKRRCPCFPRLASLFSCCRFYRRGGASPL